MHQDRMTSETFPSIVQYKYWQNPSRLATLPVQDFMFFVLYASKYEIFICSRLHLLIILVRF